MTCRLYLLHAVTGRVEGCCGPWRDNEDIFRAITAWQAAQTAAKQAALKPMPIAL